MDYFNPATSARLQMASGLVYLMSTKEKLLDRLFSRPRDFEWDELVRLLSGCGFEVISGSGSRYKFFHPETGSKLSIHRPHPESTLKQYVIREVIKVLEEIGVKK